MNTCLVVGNGFTLALLDAVKAPRSISPSQIIPPPPEVLGSDGRSSLWNERDFPCLWRSWHRSWPADAQLPPRAFYQFCEVIAADALGPDARLISGRVAPGAFELHPGPRNPSDELQLAMELRRLLWTLYTHYDKCTLDFLARSSTGNSLFSKWDGFAMLRLLQERSTAWAISYNYECVLEAAISATAGRLPDVLVKWNREKANVRPNNIWVLVKPHGSIDFIRHYEDAVLAGIPIEINSCRFEAPLRRQYPPTQCPTLPDLVPPGHDFGHLVHDAGFEQGAHWVMQQADVLIVIGLSGGLPDTTEVKRLFDHFTGRRIIHVDPDRLCRTSLMLRNHRSCAKYTHCHDVSGALEELRKMLS